MKKRLEAELISIAHRILKLKNKSELTQLHLETQKLYETLSVLKFVEDNINIVQPKINVQEVEDKLTIGFETPKVSSENEKNDLNTIYLDLVENKDTIENEIKLEADVAEIEIENFIPEIETEKPLINEEVAIEFEPLFEIPAEETEKKLDTKNPKQIFEDIIGHQYNELTFEKVMPKITTSEIPVFELEAEAEIEPEIKIENNNLEENIAENTSLLNENFSKTINFGLNDRIGFEKHLFAGSSEDMNRVISQLITYDTFEEAQDFIEEMVKPDYNNWDGKEDYAQRFMDIIGKKFS